jgi:hypothetical protein
MSIVELHGLTCTERKKNANTVLRCPATLMRLLILQAQDVEVMLEASTFVKFAATFAIRYQK